MQPAADRGADALASSGDQHDLALHAAAPGIHVRLDLNLAHRSCRRTRQSSPCAPVSIVTDLPEPDTAARAHSERVTAHIRSVIASSGHRIPFSRYMDLALYAPGLGYYAAGATKLGAAGDFVTAPEMTPLFATALASQVAAILDATERREIVELGGGSGRLAADLLLALAARDALPSRYAILEVSPDLASRQRETLERLAPAQRGRVTWIDALPGSIDGALIANEVLDAVPCALIARREGRWHERGVGWTAAPSAAGDDARGAFAWIDAPADDRFAALATTRFPSDIDYESEINAAAEALVEDIGRRMTGGAALFIDYGFPAAEYYHPQRSQGTLMCHYRHRAHGDPFAWPGLTDITAHVDFTAMAEAGERAGLEVAGYTALAPFLIGCGILDGLAATGAPESPPYLRAASSVQKLLAPSEMGELFKVLALARSSTIAWPGFGIVDRRHRL
jgi:SAM-dependent MidA family methyltransferase